jgi:hypothetical protein
LVFHIEGGGEFNKVLRRIFRRKRDVVTGEWRRLHNKELYALYSSANIISGDKVKKTEISMTRSMYGGEEWCIQGFSGET